MTGETVLIVITLVLILLVIGNIVFSKVAERRNPPIGMFTQCDGVRLHYIERGDPTAPCVVLLHGNGSMIQDFMSSGLIDLLARHNRVVCFDRPGFGYSQRPRFQIWNATAQAALLLKALNQVGVRCRAGPFVGRAGRYRPQHAEGLPNPGPCAGVRVLLPDLALGRVAHVRSSHTGPWRFSKLHGCAHHFMGHFTGSIS
jgi:hypothetical protein